MPETTEYQRVFDHADPYRSDAYANDPHGHGWDRLAAIAGEYHRGEITWAQGEDVVDDNARDLIACLPDYPTTREDHLT